MTQITRRALTGSFVALAALAACSNGIGSQGAARIDARVDATLRYMYEKYPGTQGLAQKASGMLVMPLITEAGLGVGAAYGRGALLINETTVDYYSTARASAGLQIGAQQYAHILFFMTEEALADFRSSPGWAAGANIEYALNNDGEVLSAETTTSLSPVIAVVFGQAGLRVGATLDGVKYSRIIP